MELDSCPLEHGQAHDLVESRPSECAVERGMTRAAHSMCLTSWGSPDLCISTYPKSCAITMVGGVDSSLAENGGTSQIENENIYKELCTSSFVPCGFASIEGKVRT